MGYPEFILIAIYLLTLVENLLKHGQARRADVRPWVSAIGNLLVLLLLVWGGFFWTFGVPQGIYVLLTTLGRGMIYLRRNDEEFMSREYNFYNSTISLAIVMSILAWGGFFS